MPFVHSCLSNWSLRLPTMRATKALLSLRLSISLAKTLSEPVACAYDEAKRLRWNHLRAPTGVHLLPPGATDILARTSKVAVQGESAANG